MKWIGLTGGLGTGKSTVADILRKSGKSVIDADRKAREVLEPGTVVYDKVVQHFGPGIVSQDGSIDRSRLAPLVFGSEAERLWLEQVTHPAIQESVARDRSYLQDQGLDYAFYDVPLLFEKNLENQFDAIVVVYAPRTLQIERARSRNHWNDQEIQQRLQSQMDIEDKKRKSKYVINNDGDLSHLESQVRQILAEIEKDLESPIPA